MGRTSIEWCTWTLNPIRARAHGAGPGHYCEKISQGCKNCYSSALQWRFGLPHFGEQRKSDVQPYFDAKPILELVRRRKPERAFWCDMSDLFGDWVPVQWIDQCFAAMTWSRHHTHLVLTKRSARMREYSEAMAAMEPRARALRFLQAGGYGDFVAAHLGEVPWPLPNVHLGVSCENQEAFDERAYDLLYTPAAVRFLSLEPLLGPIDMQGPRKGGMVPDYPTNSPGWTPADCQSAIDWVIVGGESGRDARPCDVQWVRWIVQQCRAGLVGCFVKQLGARPVVSARFFGNDPSADDYEFDPYECKPLELTHSKGGDPAEWDWDLRVRQGPRVRE